MKLAAYSAKTGELRERNIWNGDEEERRKQQEVIKSNIHSTA